MRGGLAPVRCVVIGMPALTYTVASRPDIGRFVSIGAEARLDRPFVNSTEQHRYSLVAAPRLRTGQRLADELFGGSAPGRIAGRRAAWYQRRPSSSSSAAACGAVPAGRSRSPAGTGS